MRIFKRRPAMQLHGGRRERTQGMNGGHFHGLGISQVRYKTVTRCSTVRVKSRTTGKYYKKRVCKKVRVRA